MALIPYKETAKRLPLDAVMTFGGFKGKTVQQVADERASYLVWAIKNISWFELTTEARKYAQRKINEQAQAAIDHAAYAGILPSSPYDGDDEEDGNGLGFDNTAHQDHDWQ